MSDPTYNGKKIGRVLFLLEDPTGQIDSMVITFKDGSEIHLDYDDLACFFARLLDKNGIDPVKALEREYSTKAEAII